MADDYDYSVILNGEKHIVIDGDTVANTEGKRFRIDGINARETEKIVRDEDTDLLEYKKGEVGAEAQKKALVEAIKLGKFNAMNLKGEKDSSDGERELVSITNDGQEDLSLKMLSSGITKVDTYTPKDSIDSLWSQRLMDSVYGKDQNPYSKIADKVDTAIDSQGIAFKTKAIDETYFNEDIHSGVQFRDHGRTLDNKAVSLSDQAAVAWGTGWSGVKEGIFGYLNAIGEVSDSEMLENLGDAGVLRAREKMLDAPKIVVNYKDVDGIHDVFAYVLNNATMSAPYMINTFAAMAAAVPVGVITTGVTGNPIAGAVSAALVGFSPAMVYAGQTWNEMKGEKGVKQFIAASTSGVAISALERLGVRGFIPESTLLSNQGIVKVARALEKSGRYPGKNIKELRQIVAKTTRQEQSKFMKDVGIRLDPKNIQQFGLGKVFKAATRGALREGGTEVIQEGIQAATAAGFSDTTYNENELWDRFINAGLAGSVLGGNLAAAGNVHKQGQNSFIRTDLYQNKLERYRVLEQAAIDKQQELNQSLDPKTNRPKTIETVEELIDKQRTIKYKNEGQYKDRDGKQRNRKKLFSNLANSHKSLKTGIKNFLKNNDDLFDYIEATAFGVGKLVKAVEGYMMPFEKMIQSPKALDIFARVGQMTTGTYHSGQNFRNYQDQLTAGFKSYIDEKKISNDFGYKKGLSSNNVGDISKQLRAFGRANGSKLIYDWRQGNLTIEQVYQRLYAAGFDKNIKIDEDKLNALYDASLMIERAYQAILNYTNDTLAKEGISKQLKEKEGYWWKHQGFDWVKVRKNPEKFKKWYMQATGKSRSETNIVYDSIVNRGTTTERGDFSLVEGEKWTPWSFSQASQDITERAGFEEWASNNIFETLNKAQVEHSKYLTNLRYFGEGGSKLNQLFEELMEENSTPGSPLTQDDIEQFAYYTKAIIDSTHGNFNRIQSPRWAAVNRFLTSWSIFAGLPLSTISSIPETAMIYFNIKDDAEWKQATDRLMQSLSSSWDEAARLEVEKAIKMLRRTGIPDDQNTVVDRVATGERDVAYIRVHEAFFRAIGIKQFTQFQRRMNAAFGLDFIKSGLKILETTPKNDNGSFNFNDFNEYEMRTYQQLRDLGINVEELYQDYVNTDEKLRNDLMDLNQDEAGRIEDAHLIRTKSGRAEAAESLIKNTTQKVLKPDEVIRDAELALERINEQIETGVYKFVNERIQNPQAANRPLWFQDPHYQLFTQFNGFLSTFTANIVPKLWNNQLRKGPMKVKYDTFVLILTMMALGGASQLIKDILKFGGPSPYLNNMGYVQRALYASGVIGQYERVIDAVKPLYPQRGEGLDYAFNWAIGEVGPSIRNIENVLTGAGQILSGDTQRGLSNALRAGPGVGPITSFRRGISDVAHLDNPFPKEMTKLPEKSEILDIILPN